MASVAAKIQACCGHSPVKAFRLAHGWTVRFAVDEVHGMCAREGLGARGLSERSWKEWEAGARLSDGYRDLLARLFRTGPVELGFGIDYTPARPGDAGIVALWGEQWGDMQRRTFLAGSAALTAGSPPGELADLMRSLQPSRRSGRISPDTLADLSVAAAAYRRSYKSTPAVQLLAAARAHLELARSLRPELQPHELRTGLLTVIAEMAALAGVICLLDQHRPDAANQYIRLAWLSAHQAESKELQCIILGGRSFAAGYFHGDHQTGLELARFAYVMSKDDASAEARAWVAAVASERAASLGHLALCQRYLNASQQILDSAPIHKMSSLGIGTFDASKLEAYEGGDMVRLGRYERADIILTAAIERLHPSQHRHRGTAFIDRAHARLATGDIDAACLDATQALELVVHTQHFGNLKRVHTLASQASATGASSGRQLWAEVMTTSSELKGLPRE